MDHGAQFGIRSQSDIVLARQWGGVLARRIGFQEGDCAVIATVVSEIARNILEFAREGEVTFTEYRRGTRHGIQVLSTDRGPGIEDVAKALEGPRAPDHTFPRGRSLSNCRKCVDEFDLYSKRGYGTAVILRKWIPEPIRTLHPPVIDWGVDSRPVPGTAMGVGTYVVSEFHQGALVAVVGGGGGGAKAALAESVVAATLSAHASEPVVPLLQRCHEAALSTSGANLGLASFDRMGHTVTWAGVGNVGGFLLRTGHDTGPKVEKFQVVEGRIGAHLPPINPMVLPLRGGDSLTFAMDGVVPDYSESLLPHWREAPQTIAERMMARNEMSEDEGALILVARYRGDGAQALVGV